MTTAPLDSRQHQILKVLDDVDASQDLASIRQLLHESPRADEVMPLVGGLVTAGYLQKVTGSPSAQRRPADRSYHAVQFRLTEQGRAQLRSQPAARRRAPAAADARDGAY